MAESQTITVGQQIANAVLPFMTSKHTASPKECVEMIAKPVDRTINELVEELKKTEDLLVNLINENRPFAPRLARVRNLIKKYSPQQ